MALKLTNFDTAHVAILNKWAAQRENDLQSHTNQLSDLNLFLENIFKQNPTLRRPNNPRRLT